jgi:hypothetical protein
MRLLAGKIKALIGKPEACFFLRQPFRGLSNTGGEGNKWVPGRSFSSLNCFLNSSNKSYYF